VRFLRSLVGWAAALVLVLLRATCRYRVENDPRPALRRAGIPYAYALLHAHQVAAVFVNDEPRLAAMVSRSADGDLLVPSLRLRRVIAVRGSSSRKGKDKGGAMALVRLAKLTRHGVPGLLAVDGPQGPRNQVHGGIVRLARDAQATILPTVVLPSRRWILGRTWDRMQFPRPFSTIRLIFGEPIAPEAHPGDAELRALVRTRLMRLEAEHDPAEAKRFA
jgi:lysophospholipid acyltransferase (LPLAT)-like uncharacterized protein